MNRCNFSLVCLVIIATQTMWAHSLVWSLVLGHPVIDMKEESITSQEKDTDLSRTTQKLPSRLTRHHHAQVIIHSPLLLIYLLPLVSVTKLPCY